jgi:peptide/nickel transport system permease protein
MTALGRWARGDAVAAVSLGVLVLLVGVSVLVPWLGSYSYATQRLEETFQPPSAAHWLGTDHLGRDVLARLAYGGRISFLISGTAVLAHTLIGLVTGLVAGGIGGRTDGVLMRLTDIFLAFPPLLFLILFTGLLGPRIPYIVLALSLVGWAGMARQLRAEALSLRTREFVVAARSLGASRARVLGRHILANVLTLAAVRASLDVGPVILSESTLSFLGIGVQPPLPSWGTMIADGFVHLRTYPRLTLYPSAVLSVAILALTFVGESLAEALDPRTRLR